MIEAGVYEVYCREVSALPRQAVGRVLEAVFERFGRKLEDLLFELSIDMPKTFEAMRDNFGPPVIGVRTIAGEKVFTLILEGNKNNALGDLQLPGTWGLRGRDAMLSWLPRRVRAWYAITDGFQISPESRPSLDWFDLPARLGCRRELLRYCRSFGYNERDALAMAEEMGGGVIVVWLIKRNGEALISDESTHSGRVFHVAGGDFSGVTEIKKPEDMLDSYCAHVCSGKPPEDFPLTS